MERNKTALGLFCGCGGMDLGAEQAGFDIVGAFDSDSDAIESYNNNLSGQAKKCDLTKLNLSSLPTNIDLLMGGSPCQGYSTAGMKKKGDPRNQLWKTYLSILEVVRPKAFILENVPRFFVKAYPQFERELTNRFQKEYCCHAKKLYAQFYGVPQRRHRTIVIGVRRDCIDLPPWPIPETAEFGSPRKKHECLISMQQALEDLGPAEAADDCMKESELDHVYLPFETKHFEICKHIPNGGSLKDIPDWACPPPYKGRTRADDPGWLWYYRKPLPDLPGRTVMASLGPTFSQIQAPDCWTKKEGDAWRWEVVPANEFTDRRGFYTSPVEPRRLTIRECARLQTFPDSFRFSGNLLSKYRQIGNAVPVEFARRLCDEISNALDGKHVEHNFLQQKL